MEGLVFRRRDCFFNKKERVVGRKDVDTFLNLVFNLSGFLVD